MRKEHLLTWKSSMMMQLRLWSHLLTDLQSDGVCVEVLEVGGVLCGIKEIMLSQECTWGRGKPWCSTAASQPSHMPQRLPWSRPLFVSRSKWGRPEVFPSSWCAVWTEYATPCWNWKTLFNTRRSARKHTEDAVPRLSLSLPLVYSRL